MFLAGCARPDGFAPALDPAAQESLPETETGRRDSRLGKGPDSIVISAWQPDTAPRAAVLAVHGYGDYGSSTFGLAAQDWAERGIVTYAYDQRGFGRNPSNADWPGHAALTDDLAAVADWVRRAHPSLPLVLIGHSMGGGVVTAAIGEGGVEADRAVLLAPALWGGEELNPFLRAMAHTANALAPEKRWTGDGVVSIQASDNIEMLRALGKDPLYVRAPSSREFVGLIRLMDRAVEAASAVETPVLVVFGAKDEVIPEGSVQNAFAEFKGPKRFERVETGWHMLLRDLEGAVVRDLVADYVLEGAPEG